MTLAIMQPYFFPYLEHFRLLASVDRWIVFDTVEYRRKTWMTRNRILNRDKGWGYISVPVTGERSDRVCEVAPAATDWRRTVLDRLAVYQHQAPFYRDTRAVVEACIAHPSPSLAELNTEALRTMARGLEIDTPIERLSQLDLDLPATAGPGEWALLIAQQLGATGYRNPAGGRHLFDPRAFSAAGVTLSFHEHRLTEYPTGSFDFVPDLSVIDPLMWVGLEQVRQWVHDSTPAVIQRPQQPTVPV